MATKFAHTSASSRCQTTARLRGRTREAEPTGREHRRIVEGAELRDSVRRHSQRAVQLHRVGIEEAQRSVRRTDDEVGAYDGDSRGPRLESRHRDARRGRPVVPVAVSTTTTCPFMSASSTDEREFRSVTGERDGLTHPSRRSAGTVGVGRGLVHRDCGEYVVVAPGVDNVRDEGAIVRSTIGPVSWGPVPAEPIGAPTSPVSRSYGCS